MNKELKIVENKAKPDNDFKEIFINGQLYKDILSKRNVWDELEKLYNGKLRTLTTKCGDIAILTLEIPYKNYKIFLKETDAKPLKILIQLHHTKIPEFNIYLKDWTTEITSFFGTKIQKTGDRVFDKKYCIQTNEPKELIKLLNNNQILKSIVENDLYILNLTYNNSSEFHTLLTVKDRSTKDIKAMKELIDLEFRIIDSFIAQGLICE
ncbi:MAG: hypothetical protein PHT07_16955 [Paludibacter sp.]|nr:hypothetical protein [Paludibacter sp.]